MQFKRPENSDKYYWTRHSIGKMMQYGLSAQRITRVIKGYQRIEEGVADNTVAVMQPTSTSKDSEGNIKWNQEIWVMYQLGRRVRVKSKSEITNSKEDSGHESDKSRYKIISAWKYPGMSPKNNPIPKEILEELQDIL